MNTPNQNPTTPDRLLEQIGVQDLADGETYVGQHGAAGGSGSSLLVRGAASGGSPMLNLATRSLMLLALAAVAAIGYGTWRLIKGRDVEAPGVAAAPLPADAFECKVRFWHGAPEGVVAHSADVVQGSLALPREGEALRAAGGQTFQVDQDRVDRFTPEGALLAVRYAGQGPAVRSVSVSFAEPTERCRALRSAGLVPGAMTFRITSEGVLAVVSGSAHPFLTAGGIVRVGASGDNISVLQFEAAAR